MKLTISASGVRVNVQYPSPDVVQRSRLTGGQTDSLLKGLTLVLMKVHNLDVSAFDLNAQRWRNDCLPLVQHLGLTDVLKYLTLGTARPLEVAECLALGNLIEKWRTVDNKFDNPALASSDQLNFMGSLAAAFKQVSRSTWNQVKTNAALFQDSKLSTALYAKPEPDMSVLGSRLHMLSKSAGFQNLFPTLSESYQLRKTNPQLADDVIATLKELRAATKILISNMLATATDTTLSQFGKPLLSVDAVRKMLAAKKVPNNLVQGLTNAKIDAEGNIYTEDGTRLSRNPIGTVVMNPDYDPELDDTYICKDPINNIAFYSVFYSNNVVKIPENIIQKGQL